MALRQADLTGHGEVHTAQVGAALFSGIEFLVSRVMNEASGDADSDIEAAMGLFSIESVDALSKLVVAPGMEQVEFAFSAGRARRTADTGQITAEKVERLHEFVSSVKRHLIDERDLDVVGAIVELRSRNPEGDRNYIRVLTRYHGDRTIIGATLTNDQYQRAVDAHKKRRFIRLVGSGVQMKTQIRMRKVEELQVVSPPGGSAAPT